MRLFIAVNFDEEIKRRILAVQARIRKETKGGNFSRPENLHLTLAFLGETPEERLSEIKDAIVCSAQQNGKPIPSFEITFSDTGFFKRGRRELWWLGAGAKENLDTINRLQNIQQALAAELKGRNFSTDSRPFTAHITLGREIPGRLWPFKTEAITIPVKRLSLMLSNHHVSSAPPDRKNILVYTELFGYDLA